MDIWLIRHGKKTGPFPDYEIRIQITRGDLERNEFVWHEGLPGWTKLEDLEIFRDEFPASAGSEKVDEPPELPKEYVERSKEREVGKETPKKHLGRRFWARWMDLVIYSAAWWLMMYAGGRDIGAAILNPWLQLSIYLPWFAIEAWLIQRFGTTPGKWLMGLRVQNEDGSDLSLKQSVWRSLRVLVTGIGFGWGFLIILCQGMSWFTTRRIGKPIWDYLGGHQVVAKPLNPFKVMALVFIFFTGIQLQVAVYGPYRDKALMEPIAEKYPWAKRFLERNEDWYFPVKN